MSETRSYRKAFVVGCPRSGTGWTLRVLRRHPLVVTGPESHLFDQLFQPLLNSDFSPQGRATALARYDAFEARPRTEDEIGGPHRWVDRETLERLLDETARLDATPEAAAEQVIEEVLDTAFAAKGGTTDHVLVEKTPRHLFYAERILRRWPEARIIEVLRDGRDVCISFEHLAKVADWAPQERSEQIRVWVDAVRHGMAVRQRPVAAGRWHVLRYEAMRADPVGEANRLFAFLELPCSPGFVEETAVDTAFRKLPPSPRVRKGEVGGWRAHFTDDDVVMFRRLAGDTLVDAGYQL
jgi:Sulfotransferase family